MRNGHFILILFFLITVCLVYLREQFDVQLSAFEDGSGEISWCIPWEVCN